MARSTLNKLLIGGSNPTLPLTANIADLPMVAANSTDKEQFVCTGNEILIAHNTGAGARTITVTSVAHPLNKRTGDIATYSIGAGEYAAFGPFKRDGWEQSNGYVYVEAEHAEVKFGVIQLP